MTVESYRLNYIRFNQDRLRVDNYKNLSTVVARGNVEPSSVGARYIIPPSFPGGDKWKKVNYLDTMTICKWFGYPDLFITFICNPKWPEIVRFVEKRGLRPEDCPDILCRVFKIKLDELLRDLKDRQIFGRTRAAVHTIEFRKRGLPHAHILLFLHREDKFPTAADVDKIISAEIPGPIKDPVLHVVVCEYMLHGPCGKAKLSSPCMIGDKCSKYYPKLCTERTTVDGDGYPIYKRSKKGVTVTKDGVPLGNESVIPYNSRLLLKYRAHINVEWYNQSRSIKYFFKYINKGSDRVTMQSSYMRRNDDDPGRFDEIKRFYDCRYLSACEAAWRIFGFDIHYRTPAVERLQFHLPDEQCVVFDDDAFIDDVVDRSSVGASQFLNWMCCNGSEERDIEVAKELLYCQFPPKFFWNKKERQWSLRKKRFSIGRLVHVPPNCGELYFMRIMLNHIKGPTCFEDIRTVNNIVYPTFREACYALGLIGDDREYIVVAVASSGIAATLIPGGITAHSRLSIPITVDEDSTCSRLKPGSDLTELLIRAKLIIWDEAPMTHKHSFEAVDKSLKDVMRVVNERNVVLPFGGKVVVFGGDFRQTLPVVPKGSRADVVRASLCSSYLWSSCKVLKLTKNMRLQVGNSDSNVEDIRKFSEWILEIGDGLAGGENDGEVDLDFPDDLLIRDVTNLIASLVNVTYPNLISHLWNPDYLQERAILAPTHEIVEAVNNYVLSLINEDEALYLSSDEVCNNDTGMGDHELHSTEYLNSIKCSGLLNHQLRLKVGAMVMLLRNIDQSRGLCNGTRLIVTDLGSRVIRCTVITGSHKGDKVYIARLTLTPSDSSRFPVRFNRRQFPVSVCFAMTINKSQGQSLSQVSIYLPRPVFSHGQLYGAISRITNKQGLKLLICDDDKHISNKTTNVVCHEIFQYLESN